MTKITIENEYGKYTVEVDKDDMTFPDLLKELVVPVLMSTGYLEKTVKEYIACDWL